MDLPVKAISVRQPWSHAIIYGGKDIENRNWKTKYRGPVCIHAAKAMTQSEEDGFFEFMDDKFPADQWEEMARRDRFGEESQYGGIIGVADIVDCVEQSKSPWFIGPYGFVLANARPVGFISVRGALGLFDWRKKLEKVES